MRLSHRFQQVIHYVAMERRSAPDLPPDAFDRLTPPMLHQFRILEVGDQEHLLFAYQWLVDEDADDDTITAGLIHDVGKACAKCHITVIDRAMHVFLTRVANPLYRRFAAIEVPPAWLRSIHRLANHPARGALAAKQAGYNERVADLIRHHESGSDPKDVQAQLLRRADTYAGRSS